MEFDRVLQNFIHFGTVKIWLGCSGMEMPRLQVWPKHIALTVL